MKYEIVREFPHDIIFEKEDPCISIYQKTHRYAQDYKKDLIVFKKLVDEVENSLKEKFSKEEIQPLLKALKDLEEDRLFWNKTKDGMAILLNRNKFIIYILNRPVKELAVVSNSFHLKPLIRIYQSADNYYVLGVNRQTFKLFVGNRYKLKEVEFNEGTPIHITEVLGDQYTESYLSQGSYGGASKAMYHGHGSKKDEIDKDIERYLQYVDRLILNEFSNPTKTPLVLASLDEYQGLFRKISHNPYLLDQGIRKDFSKLDIKDLRNQSWEIVEEIYLEKTEKLVNRYNLAKSKDLGSDDLELVINRAINHRVETVLIESDRVIPGRINFETGEIQKSKLSDPETDDLLDDLTEIVFNAKGHIVLLPKEKMPSNTGLAATFRY